MFKQNEKKMDAYKQGREDLKKDIKELYDRFLAEKDMTPIKLLLEIKKVMED